MTKTATEEGNRKIESSDPVFVTLNRYRNKTFSHFFIKKPYLTIPRLVLSLDLSSAFSKLDDLLADELLFGLFEPWVHG